MNLFGLMDVSASALQAQRVRAEVVAANMANAETTRTAEGGPYQRQHVVFEAEDGGSFGSSLLEQAQLSSAQFTRLSPSTSHLKRIGLLNGGLTGASGGVEGVAVKGVIADTSEPLRRYEPGHPDADAQGFVAFPDINPLTEMVDLMGASRSYGMNASAVQAEKTMIAASLDLGK
jgi:flagellar basal-body rod protein FlgC